MALDLQPHLRGATLCLRPLQPADREPLWVVAGDRLLWEQHPDKTRSDPAGFARFFQAALDSRSALAVVEADGTVAGSTRYYDWDPAAAEIAIGYTFIARRLWGGAANREIKRLVLGHAFTAARTAWFHVAATNMRSRRAMEKLGARLSHHAPRPQNGRMMDFCFYRIDREDWQQQERGE